MCFSCKIFKLGDFVLGYCLNTYLSNFLIIKNLFYLNHSRYSGNCHIISQ